MFSEHLGYIARPRVSAGDIYHRLVHAYIADHRASLAAHPHFAAVIGEPPVKTIVLADRDDRYRAVLVEFGMPPVADCLAGFDGLDGEDSGLERAHIPQFGASEGESV